MFSGYLAEALAHGFMKELFLFVRPPRPLWPLNGPSTSFWPPLAFASLAAALREKIRDLRVAILDAPTLKMGWRTLENEIRRLQPAFIGIGEEAVSCVEGLRLARLAKDCGAQVIAGGCFFGHVAPQILQTRLVDIVVHGEGEETIVELTEALRLGGACHLRNVAGISFLDDGEVIFTGHRPLLADLDLLPFPAYDLLPVGCYGKGSRNHPQFAAIEMSRGCVDSCAFCVLWRHMGHFHGLHVAPRLRVKSPERLMEEIHRLVRKFDRRYLGWVDPCFNAHPHLPAELAELLLKEDFRLGQSAWMRADAIIRDEASGALATCVRAGLNEAYVGIERGDSQGLLALKKGEDFTQVRAALSILSNQYPHVFTIGSFIYGLPGDTPKTVRDMYRLSIELGVDKAFFIPLTPLPGTPFWREELWDPTGERFRGFHFLPNAAVNSPTRQLDRTLITCCALNWGLDRIQSYFKGLTSPDARKRRLTWRVFVRSVRLGFKLAFQAITGQANHFGMIFPRWYES